MVALARFHPLAVAVGLSTLLSLVYLIWEPQTTDLAAQTFRADLWERAGFVIWNPDWYGGHPVPGYSLIYPPLGATFGVALTGAASTVASAWLFGRIALDAWGERAWLGVIWFGLGSVVSLYSGRTTFALGVALGLGALLAVQRERPAWAAVAGALTAAASPVAGLFVGMLGAAVLLADRFPLHDRLPMRPGEQGRTVPSREPEPLPVRAALAAAVGAGLVLGLMAVAFPTPGFHPFGVSAFIWLPLLAIVVFWFAHHGESLVIWSVILYALIGLAAVLADTPLGGNVMRLGATFAGPLLAIVLLRRHPVLLALLAIPLLAWQWETTIRDVARAERDPSTAAAYYAPLLAELEAREGQTRPLRVHLPPTQSRWEAVYVAEQHPITRGWLRQEETDDFPLFNNGPIDPGEYVEWLAEREVDYVAIHDAEPDYTARTELRLARGDEYPLKRVWESEHWRLYKNTLGAADLSPGSGAASRLDRLLLRPDGFTVIARGPSVSVPVRYTPYFRIVSGQACVERDPASEQRTRIKLADPDAGPVTVRVEARLSLAGALGRDRDCSGSADPG